MLILTSVVLCALAIAMLGRWADIRTGELNAACPNERPSMAIAAWSWLPIAAMILVALFWPSVSKARDDGRYANSGLKPWFDSLRSGKGPCCSDADGYALSDVDWSTNGVRYRVRIPRSNDPVDKNKLIWVDVPDDAVITEPNRAGRTMVWPIWGYQGPSIRCFMPGSMT